MGLTRLTVYDSTPTQMARGEILARIGLIYDDFECYGNRWFEAALCHQGVVVNSVRRQMRDHDLQPKQRRRYVVTTDSEHAGPIFPDLAKNPGIISQLQQNLVPSHQLRCSMTARLRVMAISG